MCSFHIIWQGAVRVTCAASTAGGTVGDVGGGVNGVDAGVCAAAEGQEEEAAEEAAEVAAEEAAAAEEAEVVLLLGPGDTIGWDQITLGGASPRGFVAHARPAINWRTLIVLPILRVEMFPTISCCPNFVGETILEMSAKSIFEFRRWTTVVWPHM